MCKRNLIWDGPGNGYDPPDASDELLTANMYGRQGTQPKDSFLHKQSASSISAPGAKNAGDPGAKWGATETADEIARRENFKF